jgi:hypothetical protein
MPWRHRSAVALLGLVLMSPLTGCAESSGSDVGLGTPGGKPRTRLFEPGQIVWASGSTIHVGAQTFDVAPQRVHAIDWTPYGLYLELFEDAINGPYASVFFDGERMTEIDEVHGDIITSPDGELAAWFDGSGPTDESGRFGHAVVVDSATGEVVFSSERGISEDSDISPTMVDLNDERLIWSYVEGAEETMTSYLATGTTAPTEPSLAFRPIRGYEYFSPDGRYRVDATRNGAVVVRPRQPDYGYPFQRGAGWLRENTLIVVGLKAFPEGYDVVKGDQTPGALLTCDLDEGTCEEVATVVGAQQAVFSGVDRNF